MSDSTVEITVKYVLEVPTEEVTPEFMARIEEAVHGEASKDLGTELWKLGAFVDMYVQRVEQRNILYRCTEEQ